MTTANKITIGRILLIPVFVGCAMYYGQSVAEAKAGEIGDPDERLRIAAILAFALAAISDGLDGFIARRFNQRSRLGVILDPLADKGLLLSGIITLSLTDWGWHFPLWFPILVVTRDALLISGAFIVNHVVGKVKIQPHWTGKTSTVAQMVAIGFVMLGAKEHSIWPTYGAGFFTLVSAALYVREGIRQLQSSGVSNAGLEGDAAAAKPGDKTQPDIEKGDDA